MTAICAACGHEMPEKDAMAAAGPYGASWYCRDFAGCRERQAAER